MIIDFSNILSNEGSTIELSAPIDMESFKSSYFDYHFDDKKPVQLELTGMGKNAIGIKADIDVTLDIPCARCLENTKKRIFITASKELDLTKVEDDGSDEDFENFKEYIEGTSLDIDKLVYGEILVNLPMKVLCKDDCKGLCNRCGTNLNHKTCGCDTTEIDSRMAKILEVYNSYKEV